MRQQIALVTSGMLIACLAAECARRDGDRNAIRIDVATVLWVPERAAIEHDGFPGPLRVKDGRRLFADGSGDISFGLTGDRETLTRELLEHFAGGEWHQRDRDYLNPQIATSFQTGWRHACGCILLTDAAGKPIPRAPHYDWHDQWENPRGDILAYALSADAQQLRGYASFIPKHIVDMVPR